MYKTTDHLKNIFKPYTYKHDTYMLIFNQYMYTVHPQTICISVIKSYTLYALAQYRAKQCY